jgi:hypothetical protein
MNQTFTDLCRDLGRELPDADFDELLKDACLEMDGVAIALDADDEANVGMLSFFVDIGAVDAARKAEWLRQALSFNLSDESDEHGVLGLDDGTGHLVLVSSMEWPSGSTVAQLVEQLRGLVRFRKDFETRLQDGSMPHSPAPAWGGGGLHLA